MNKALIISGLLLGFLTARVFIDFGDIKDIKTRVEILEAKVEVLKKNKVIMDFVKEDWNKKFEKEDL
jgi:hypothetical protein